MELYKYKSYEHYKQEQTDANIRKIETVWVDENSLIEVLNYVDDKLLVKPKLSVLRDCIKRGEKTIIFITLIKGTLIPITNWLIKNNFTYCVYTGNDKENIS